MRSLFGQSTVLHVSSVICPDGDESVVLVVASCSARIAD